MAWESVGWKVRLISSLDLYLRINEIRRRLPDLLRSYAATPS